jgi:hypothetical protein
MSTACPLSLWERAGVRAAAGGSNGGGASHAATLLRRALTPTLSQREREKSGGLA